MSDKKTFESELRDLINKHSIENESNTPDYILAEYICDVLDAYADAVKRRDEHNNLKTA